jgi:hypothetical protein
MEFAKQQGPGLHRHGSSAAKLSESPSQIPDSQPITPWKPVLHSILDASPHASTPSSKQDYTVSSSTHVTPQKPLSRVYQPTIRPSRAVSLEPVTISPPNAPVSTDYSISPDHLPNKHPVFTSTPKSKPLKALLREPV